MRNILIFSLFFFILNFSFSQTENLNFLPDTSFTLYDLIYINESVKNEQININSLYEKISTYQNEVYKKQNILSNLDLKKDLYLKLYGNLLKYIYIFNVSLSSNFVFVFSSKSFNIAYSRYLYLKLLSHYVKTLNNYIVLLTEEYTNELDALVNVKSALDSVLYNYQTKKQLITDYSTLLVKEANLLQQNALKIRNTIQNQYEFFKLIESSIINSIDLNSKNDTVDFSVLIGNMKSPINEPVIISSFGIHSHQYLKNVTIKNDGIDLYSKLDTVVKSVYQGQVINIVSVYKNGKSVILKHGNYFTVYSNLNIVYVVKNQLVYDNQPLGTLSIKTSKYSFPCLNFQIWKNSEKLNPNNFLNL